MSTAHGIGTAWIIYGNDGMIVQVIDGQEEFVNQYCAEKGYTYIGFPMLKELQENDLPF